MKELKIIELNLESLMEDFEEEKILKELKEIQSFIIPKFRKIKDILKRENLIRCKLNWKIMKKEDHNCNNCSCKCENLEN